MVWAALITVAMCALLSVLASTVAGPECGGGKPGGSGPSNANKNFGGAGINHRYSGPTLLRLVGQSAVPYCDRTFVVEIPAMPVTLTMRTSDNRESDTKVREVSPMKAAA